MATANKSRKQANADAIYESSRRAFKRGNNKKGLRLLHTYLRRKPCGIPKGTAEIRSMNERSES